MVALLEQRSFSSSLEDDPRHDSDLRVGSRFVAIVLVSASYLNASERLPDVPLDGPRASAAAIELRRELTDEATSEARRQQVGLLLGRIGAEAIAAIDDLVLIAKDEPNNRRWALKALSLYGDDLAPVVPTLIEFASDESLPLGERMIAAEGLARSGPSASDAVMWFYQRLQNRSLSTSEERSLVILAGLLGPAGDVLTPTLLQKLESPDAETRRFAASSIGQIGSSLAIDGLMQTILDDESEAVADAAAAALDQVSGPVEEAFRLIVSVGDWEDRQRVAKFWTRQSLMRSTVFEQLLKDASRQVRFAAARALLAKSPSRSLAVIQAISKGNDTVARDARVLLRKLAYRDRF